MHEMNLTQKDLSKLLDMTPPRLSEILNEKKEPTYRQAQKIATTLNIDANMYLLSDSYISSFPSAKALPTRSPRAK